MELMYASLPMARLGQVKLSLWMDLKRKQVTLSNLILNLKAGYYRVLLCSYLLKLSALTPSSVVNAS